jgi:hypothetical protein
VKNDAMVDLLIENSNDLVEDLLPIRYGRMMVSPFTFYRGAAAVMAYDLSHTSSQALVYPGFDSREQLCQNAPIVFHKVV